MIGKFLGSVIAALSPAQPAQAAPVAAPDYAQPSNWICLPGRIDVCSKPLATTALTATGYGARSQSTVAKDPPLDCFYVYPTVSQDPAANSDLKPSEELGATQAQFARFASVCRTFAPLYRQMTVASVAVVMAGGDVKAEAELAFSDVERAWGDYLAHYNKGRPFVLIGHSQGSLMLQELIKRDIEGKPAAKLMVRAIIPGFNVFVPQGKRVGGTFKSTPLCGSPKDTGCVMAWSGYRQGTEPPEGAMFGWAPPGMTVGCTNPANPGSTAWEPLDSYWYARPAYAVRGGPIVWSSEGPPPTPYLRTQGLVEARCVNDGRRGYLSIRTVKTPSGKRTARIPGEVGIGDLFLPGWGMHLVDLDIGQGNLIDEVGALGSR